MVIQFTGGNDAQGLEMDWRENLYDIYRTLDTHEVTNELLRRLDKLILSDSVAAQVVFEEAIKRLREILSVYYDNVDIELDVGNSDKNKQGSSESDKKHKYIKLTNERNEIHYVRGINISFDDHGSVICKSPDKQIARPIDEKLINAVLGVGQQLNVCLKNEIEQNINRLYRKIIYEFSKSGVPQKVFAVVCNSILNDFFPNLPIYDYGNNSEVRVQLLILDKIDDLYGGSGDSLLIIGSTNTNDLGFSLVGMDDSICGTLFSSRVDINREGYYSKVCRGNTLTYYLGDPREHEKFKKTMPGDVEVELAIPLMNKDGSLFAVINIESNNKNAINHLHAVSILQNSIELGELVSHFWDATQNRSDIFRGLFYKLEDYLSKALREFRHGLKTPQNLIDAIRLQISELECQDEKEKADICNGLSLVNTKITTVRKLLGDSLEDFIVRKDFISLKTKIEVVVKLVIEELKESNIMIDYDGVPDDFPLLRLDNLFSQFLYDTLQNSIDGITREINYRKSKQLGNGDDLGDKEDAYVPMISISAKVLNNWYSLGVDSDVAKDVSSAKKCMISIKDNGIGVEPSKLDSLTNKGVTYRGGGGTGYGLYAFKQYLSLYNGIILPIESDDHKGFTIRFVVDGVDFKDDVNQADK